MSTSTSTLPPKLEPTRISEDSAASLDGASFSPLAPSPRADLQYLMQSARTALPLLVSDLFAVTLSVFVASFAVSLLPLPEMHHLGSFLMEILLTIVVINFALGLYPGVGLHPACELRGTVLAIVALGVSFSAAAMMIGGITSPYLVLSILTALLVLVTLFPMRMLARHFCSRTSWWGHPAVILGSVDKLPELQRALRMGHFPGIRLAGQFCDASEYLRSQHRCQRLGGFADAAEFCERNQIFWAFLPRQILEGASLESFSKQHQLRFRQIFAIDSSTAVPNLWSSPVDLGGITGMHLRERLLMPSHRVSKRTFDLVVASALLVLLAPLLIGVAIAVKLTSRGPIIYGHKRLGQGGKHFKSLKFRTMVKDADRVLSHYLAENPELQAEWHRDHKLKNDPRITRIGTFLRKSSLDELPQLWNVIRGEMSLVGPRPIVDSEIPKYNEVFHSYSRVRPGITGLWQISGRNNTTYAERVAFDEFYVRNWSPWYDLYILMSTVKTVLLREGAY